MKAHFLLLIIATAVFTAISSCTVDTPAPRSGKDPYGSSIVPAVKLDRSKVLPDHGKVGDTIQVFGVGFAEHLDDVVILFNGQSAEIISATDSTAKVVVPTFASSGRINARVKQEYSFGPQFRVDGQMNVDQNFPSIRGANGAIMDIEPLPNGQYLIVGDFTNYDNANIDGGINRVARINHDGTLDHNFEYGKKLNGKITGSSSIVNCAAVLDDGSYLVAGAFSSFSGYSYVQSIAHLNQDGTLDTVTIDRPSGDTLVVSTLLGGVNGTVNGMHVQDDGKIIITGLFRYYLRPDYFLTSVSGRDSLHLDSTLVNFIARLNPDGSLDTTYNYDLGQHRGKESVNGPINASVLLPDGKLIIAGNFTKYNGKSINRIARLNTDGSLDETFKPGEGADQEIYDVILQPDGKLVIGGSFNHYDQQRTAHIARLNTDGTFDASFKVGEGPNGPVIDLGIMPAGHIIASGFFIRYNDITRNGFVILNSDGSLSEAYNTNGGLSSGGISFSGIITDVVQLPDENAFLTVGTFTKFDGFTNNRIMRIAY